jgi:hypothetical protein
MNQRDMESFAQARAEVRRANERDARPNLKLGYSFEDVFGE